MIRVTADARYQKSAALYFAFVAAVWCLLFFPPFFELDSGASSALYAALWFFGYGFLSLTTAQAFVTYAAFFFVKEPRPLPEVNRAPAGKSVAIVFPVRNTEVGFYERLKFSLKGNLGGHFEAWILSDSDGAEESKELEAVLRLRNDFPRGTIYYRRRKRHLHFKHGNLAEWLFCCGGRRYDYFFILDADSLMTAGTIEKLLRKAEHPANRTIWNFQCKTAIIHDFTRFAGLQKIGLRICERLHFPVMDQIFGQWISYGHSNLVRTKCYLHTMPPTDELSHDIWDAAATDKAGYRSVIVSDVTVYEEAPANYLIALKRERRWAQGSLSALKILFDHKVSLAERFFVFHGGLQYLNNTVFFFWLLLQFWGMAFREGALLDFPPNVQVGNFAANSALFFTTLFAMGTFLIHPFLAVRSLKDVRDFAGLILYSNLTLMLNLTNGCFNVLSLLIHPVRVWVPMEKDPFAQSPMAKLLIKTLPASVISVFLFALAWQSGRLWWICFVSPMLVGGIFSPLACCWSTGARKRKQARMPALRKIILPFERKRVLSEAVAA